MGRSAGPIKAAEKIRAAVERLRKAQKQGLCFVNFFFGRKRTAFLEVLTFEVAKHPLMDFGRDGVVVHSFVCDLQRTGRLLVSGRGRSLAFLSWHALGRMKERSEVDIFLGRGAVAMCGLVGALMRASSRHFNTTINLAISDDAFCNGVLRCMADYTTLGFFDVFTVLPRGDDERWRQAEAMFSAVHDYYTKSKDGDPRGYWDEIAVLPAREDDYVSRELARNASPTLEQ